MSFVKLGELVHSATVERAGERDFTVLSMTRAAGLVPQVSVFKKTVASRDLTKYKIVRPNQLVVGIHIDEGALGFSGPEQEGIVSPAYKLWELANPESVHIPYLDRFIRSEIAIRYFISKYRETAERRGKLTNEQFLALDVHLPPLPEQKRIAAILDAADALRAKRRESLEQLDQLLQSTFLEMFGDPVTNPKNFPVKSLPDFYIGKRGGTKCGPFGSALKKDELVSSGVPVWNMDNIDPSGRMAPPFRMWITEDKFEQLAAYAVFDGDVLISRAGTVGKMCVARTSGSNSIISTNLIRVRFNSRLLPIYFVSLMTYCKGRVGRLKTGPDGAFTHMSTKILDTLKFPYPPLDLQQRFATIVESIEQQKARYRAQLDEFNTLFASLQARAFKGEL